MKEFDSSQIYLDVSNILHANTLMHNIGLGEREKRQTMRG